MPVSIIDVGAKGPQYQIVENKEYPIIQGTPEGAGGAVDFKHLYNLGIYQGDQSEVMYHACGAQSGFPILKSLQFMGIKTRALGSNRHIYGRGTESKYRGFVKSITTGDATGLQEITVKVGATLPDGTNSNLNFISALMTIETNSGEQFIVVEVSTDTDGYQLITVQRKNGAANLVVAGGNNADFMLGSYFVTMSAERDQDPEVGFQDSAQYNVNFQKEEVWLSNKTDSYTTNGIVINQKSTVSADYVLFQMTGARDTNGNPIDGAIYGYIRKQEALHFARFISQNYYSMIYEEPNFNNNVNVLPGGGLLAQVAPEMRFNIAPSAMNFQTIENLLGEMKQANPFMGSDIHIFCGLTSWQQIMRSVQADRPTYYMAEPSKTPENIPFEGIWMGATMAGFVTTWGCRAHFHLIEILDNTPYSTANSPSRPRAGNKSSDVIIIDPSPMMNYPMPSADSPTMDWNGDPIQEPYGKIEMLTRKDGGFRDNWSKGTIDPQGRPYQGEVYDMRRMITRQIEHYYGMAIHDPHSVIHCTSR